MKTHININNLTPIQKQWMAAKKKAKDAIVLFRLGDFYELFSEDAQTIAPILELNLTSRDGNIPMAGFPHHASAQYIFKLLKHGFKVALCEQLEPSHQNNKGIIKRDITRIITPGTNTDDDSSNSNSNNYLIALSKLQEEFHLAAIDISTGSFLETTTNSMYDIFNETIKFDPLEILVITDFYPNKFIETLKSTMNKFHICHFETFKKNTSSATELIFNYIKDTQPDLFKSTTPLPIKYAINNTLSIDITSRDNLDLQNLFKTLKKTNTAMGNRLIQRLLNSPSKNIQEIELRHKYIQWFIDNDDIHKSIQQHLKQLCDIEKLTIKIASSTINPKELGLLRNSLLVVPKILEAISKSSFFIKSKDEFNFTNLSTLLDKSLIDSPPISNKEGNIFKQGFDQHLDSLKTCAYENKNKIAIIEQSERRSTGISSLKVKYTKTFGYYIEITQSHISKVPIHYTRKQTIVSGERFTTNELTSLESQVTLSEFQQLAKEQELYDTLKQNLRPFILRLSKLVTLISKIDAFSTFAEISISNRYSKPKILDSNDRFFEIIEGRHPIIEHFLEKTGKDFIPNSISFNTQSKQIALITGPNMAGKSTILRQTALIQILAQAGCFVPAKHATLSICDKIFTRVGASDNPPSGKSTFMVEMQETAHILQNATQFSLLFLDEIGRGTSTYDGMSIAWAITEHIHNNIKAFTLFATHYHELSNLCKLYPRIYSLQTAISENKSEIQFLYTLIEGAAKKSYGIYIAESAGIPIPVIKRAKEILNNFEHKTINHYKEDITPNSSKNTEIINPILAKINNLNLDKTTPLDALIFLSKLKEQLQNTQLN